jgi:hypothetical protein
MLNMALGYENGNEHNRVLQARHLAIVMGHFDLIDHFEGAIGRLFDSAV